MSRRKEQKYQRDNRQVILPTTSTTNEGVKNESAAAPVVGLSTKVETPAVQAQAGPETPLEAASGAASQQQAPDVGEVAQAPAKTLEKKGHFSPTGRPLDYHPMKFIAGSVVRFPGLIQTKKEK